MTDDVLNMPANRLCVYSNTRNRSASDDYGFIFYYTNFIDYSLDI